MAFLKLSRYKDFGNARKSAAISGLVLIEFITIHNTGKIKIIHRLLYLNILVW